MPSVKRSALVPYSAAEMYALVNDIESYPQFLPWCRSTRILHRNEDEVRATIEMKKGALHKSFTTINRLQPGKRMEVSLVEGPFRKLDGFWCFDGLRADASKVSLDLDFELAGPVVGRVIGPIFHQIANSLVDAFCKRAVQVYGRR